VKIMSTVGAWGKGPFENDDALDWVVEWEDAEDLSPARDVLDDVLLADDYLDSREGFRGVAAAQVVAVLVGAAPPDTLPEELRTWVAAHPDAANEVDEQSVVLALDRVLAENSELADLWREAGDKSWFDEVRGLRAAVKPPTG
jgi:hypothetical protein